MARKPNLSKVLTEPSACFFCGTVGPRTKEHVLPNWLNNRGYGGEGEGFREYISERPRTRHTENANPFGKTVKIVCRHCNNEWMKDMEDAVQPVLLSMFATREQQITLNYDAQLALARWGFKTAAILSQAVHPGGDFPVEHRRAFHDQDRIPDSVQVRIGTAGEREQSLGLQLGESHHLPRQMHISIDGQPQTVQFYLARFRLLNVAFEVIGTTSSVPIAMDPGSGPSACLLPLWPPTKPTLCWPPARSIDEFGGLDALAKMGMVGVSRAEEMEKL
jgi:hypothetical protein